jgi:membrane associated rhomboid family serine protease
MNEQNNNIDNNIINDENNIDNNLNNNNMNNANNNQINFEAPHNVNYANKYKKITISFIIILFINLIIETYSYFIRTNYRKYVFQYAPIFEKNQYYRFISSYFIHYGIWHIIVELYLTYEICYLFENIMGTLITILFIMNTMIMNSVLHFLMIPLVSLFFKITRTSYDLNYDYESSLTSVLFSMTTFYYLFKDNKNKKIDVLYTFILNLNYLSITMFFVLYFLTPNKSFYSNLSGLINGYLFKFFPFIFLPRVTWVTDFEKFIGLKKYENVYRSITYKNGPMKNALNELQNNSIVDESLLKNINYGNDFNNIGQQMTELTNIQNNNLNNN